MHVYTFVFYDLFCFSDIILLLFLLCDIYYCLVYSEIDDKSHLIDLLRKEFSNLKHDLDTSKQIHHEINWHDIETLNESTREVYTKNNKHIFEIDRITQKLAFVQEGLLFLMKNVDSSIRPTLLQTKYNSTSGTDLSIQTDSIILEELSNMDGGTNKSENRGLWTPNQAEMILQH